MRVGVYVTYLIFLVKPSFFMIPNESYLVTTIRTDTFRFEQIVYTNQTDSNSSGAEAPFLDLNLFVSYGTVSSNIYDKPYGFDIDVFNFPFLDSDILKSPSFAVQSNFNGSNPFGTMKICSRQR